MKLITTDLIEGLIAQAGASPRHRMNHNVHSELSDPVQRLFVAARRDSYFRPHRHPDKWEFALVISGAFELLVFDDAGRLTARQRLSLGAETIGLELPANTWHTWLALTDDAVFFETKQGPFDPPPPSSPPGPRPKARPMCRNSLRASKLPGSETWLDCCDV